MAPHVPGESAPVRLLRVLGALARNPDPFLRAYFVDELGEADDDPALHAHARGTPSAAAWRARPGHGGCRRTGAERCDSEATELARR